MHDRYHFWVQMAQADQTSISAWETAVRTAAGRCSFGPNAGEFMRDKFLFGLDEYFSRFREDIFCRDEQRKPEDPPFTLAFVVSQAVSFEVAQQTNKLLAHSSIEEQVHYATSTTPARNFQRPPSRPISKACFFCGSKPQHPRICPPKDKHTATATSRATFQVSANRSSEISDPPNHRPKSPSYQLPTRTRLYGRSEREFGPSLCRRNTVRTLLHHLRSKTSYSLHIFNSS